MEEFAPSAAIQTNGCTALKALASVESNCAVLVQTGACRCIYDSISRHIGDEDTIAEALTALRMISVSSDARSALRSLGSLDNIAHAMKCTPMNKTIQRDGCALLSNLSIDTEQRTVSQLSMDVMEAIVGALDAHSSDNDVVSIACFTLKNFTYEERNLRSLRSIENVFEVLHGAMKSESCEDACVVLERILLSRAEDESLEEQVQASLLALLEMRSDDENIVSEVIDIMQCHQWSARVTIDCIRALNRLARGSETHMVKLQQDAALDIVLNRTQTFETDGPMSKEALSLLELLNGDGKIAAKTVC
jgi:dsRNA-specific ribonuclease